MNMRLNKKVQYGILFCLHLTRSGRTTVEQVSKDLGISKPFLTQVAAKLRKSGVVDSLKGPGGGYDMRGTPTVREIMRALGVSGNAMTAKEKKTGVSRHENRALRFFAEEMEAQLATFLDKTVARLGNDLLLAEVNQMTNHKGMES